MIQLASIGTFALKHWKALLLALIVSGIVYTIYSQKAVIADLTADLIITKQELENVKENYATQTELNKVREEISTANLRIIEKVNKQNRQVTNSLNKIESDIAENGSEVEKLQMQLHPDVADFIDKEIEERGYDK